MLIKDHPECTLTLFCKVVLSKANTSQEMAFSLRVVITVVTCVSISSTKSMLGKVYNRDTPLSGIPAQILEAMKHYLVIRPNSEENVQWYAKTISWFTPTPQSDHLKHLHLQTKSEVENNGIFFPLNFTTKGEECESKEINSLQECDEAIKSEEGEITYHCNMSRSIK